MHRTPQHLQADDSMNSYGISLPTVIDVGALGWLTAGIVTAISLTAVKQVCCVLACVC